jgi:hypothetical protein
LNTYDFVDLIHPAFRATFSFANAELASILGYGKQHDVDTIVFKKERKIRREPKNEIVPR